MNISIRFFFLTALFAFLMTSFSSLTYAQTGAPNQVDPVFNAENTDDWNRAEADYFLKIEGIPGEAKVLATHKRAGTKFIAVMRGGKIMQVGMVPQRGGFKALTPSSSPCYKPICYSFQIPHCFTLPWGECVCVCGAWITSGN